MVLAVCSALNRLPSGSTSAVEVPDLQPGYVGNKPPRPGATSFVIKLWQLQRQRWLLSKSGGAVYMEKQGNTASWQYFNVTAEAYEVPDCFAAAFMQVWAGLGFGGLGHDSRVMVPWPC